MNIRVDWRASVSLVGTVVKYLAVALLLPLATAVWYGDGLVTFGASILVAVALGTAMERLDADPDLGAREGFLMVGLTWLAVAVVGAVPYLIAGEGSVAVPTAALFESMSGFTTTGATVMADISFDTHSRALLLWRQQTQWLGGMGIVVLAVAILPELSVGGAQLMDAEAPGPGIEKLTPRIAETARVLWLVYLGFTVVEFFLLYGLHLAGYAPEMTFYNAVAHPLTTMPTGGFSPEARSIEAFSAVVQWVIIPFMVAAGTNFALFWHVLRGETSNLFGDSEFRTYAGAIGVVSAVGAALLFVGPNLVGQGNPFPVAGDLEASLRHATFQAVSIVTTTGYASMDFEVWSGPAQYVLVFAMFIGGSAGSTGGGIKIVRWLVIVKSIRRELFTTVHPEAVRPVRLGGRALDERALRGIYAFTLLYFALFLVGALLLAVDAARVGLDLAVIEAVTASAATLGNIGPGLGMVGPMGSYLDFPATSKLLMVGLMWVGRLEIIPVLVLLTSGYWRS
ncbi:TrkH family potassium uptake protein [Halostella litorea]|uniref:TrkH family potassium uptake protein n=1 Tax=Halostella litorea TaxID=2528831 RepID=UPI001092B545|nr:TrkH family potassium uptake protein [Halostella litorea]